jgi:hypothetical protein
LLNNGEYESLEDSENRILINTESYSLNNKFSANSIPSPQMTGAKY